MARKLLFVAREGGLIERGPRARVDLLDELRLMPQVIPALLRLVRGGYEIVVVDDDPSPAADGAAQAAAAVDRPAGAAVDRLAGAAVDRPVGAAVDRFLEALLASQGVPLAAIRHCPHSPRTGSKPETRSGPEKPSDSSLQRCDCPKPGLGLVREFVAGNAMNRELSAVVGDRGEDLELAANMGIAGYSLKEVGWPDIAHALLDRPRTARVCRRTRETDIEVEIDLDREAEPRAATGIAFFDHMLEQLGKHAGIELRVTCRGDLEVDEHHTVEDVALALGQALRQALGDKRGIGRYGFVLPMDEAEAEVSLDLGGRPYLVFDGTFARERVGGLPTELVPHFFRSIAEALGAAVHVKVRGENAHHMVESAFKGFARALRQACVRSGETLPSTKGLL